MRTDLDHLPPHKRRELEHVVQLIFEEFGVLPDNVIPWPGSLREQVSAVQSILSAANTPLAAADVARSFKGKRPATVRPVLDALAGIGMARRLKDGRCAA